MENIISEKALEEFVRELYMLYIKYENKDKGANKDEKSGNILTEKQRG